MTTPQAPAPPPRGGMGEDWHPGIPVEWRNSIVTGDARELASSIPDESVDLCFTDPPYLREFIPLYGWLAAECARVLKPGGYLLAYVGGYFLPEICAEMLGRGLDFFYQFVLLHNNGKPRIWSRRLMSGYKPVLVFTKGTPALTPWQGTVFTDAQDKRFHEWGQGDGMAIKTLELLTRPGDVVWEPFTGGGSTISACIRTGRNYVAFEQDPATADVARARAACTDRPLFTLETADLPPLTLDLLEEVA